MANENTNKKLKEIFSVSNIIYASIVLLALVAAIVLAVMGRAKPIDIPDENGEEDYSLAVLTLDDICAENPKFSCEVFGVARLNEEKSHEQGDVYDAGKMVGEAIAKFSGVSVLQKTYGKTDTVTFTLDCKHTKGNMRVVLLDDRMNVIHDFEVGEVSTFTLKNAEGKNYEIRIAGESAEFNVTVERAFE